MMGDLKCFKKYQIYKNQNTGKCGIRDTDMDTTIVKCVFDNIEFYKESNLVIFTIQEMQSVLSVDDIPLLAY